MHALKIAALAVTAVALAQALPGIAAASPPVFSTEFSFSGTANGNVGLNLTVVGGNLYGTTFYGGASNAGAVYKFNIKSGEQTLVYSFPAPSGGGSARPYGALVLDNGVLFGTTAAGGSASMGSVYKIVVAGGRETDLHSFTGPDGSAPIGALALYNGKLYGTCEEGGTNQDAGTVFSVDISSGPASGTVAVVAQLPAFSQPSSNLIPYGGLLYGTARGGAVDTNGSIFSVNPDTGALATLFGFSGKPDGSDPNSALVLSGSTIYGGTDYGGPHNDGVLFSYDIATATETTLHKFNGTNGSGPEGLILKGKYLYGTALVGGTSNNGVLFKTNPATGATKVLHNFDGTDGTYPLGLVMKSGALFGITETGGTNGCPSNFSTSCGVIYRYGH